MEWLLWLLLAVVALWVAVTFNFLVRDRNRVEAAWSDIDVQLKRRHDLVPKLVEAVRRYADYEQATLSAVTALREEALRVEDVSGLAATEARLSDGVRRLVAVAENYPDLKADQGFLDLQAAISDVEDHIQYARRYYNGAVRNLNTRIDSFPDNFVARVFRFRQAAYFDAGL